MKGNLLVIFLLFFAGAGNQSFAQTTIAEWNFNTAFSAIAANGTAPGPSTGTGSVRLLGTTTAIDATGATADPGGPPNNALNTRNYPTQGQGSETSGILITTSTTGYQNIIVSFYQRNSSSAANTCVLDFRSSDFPIWTTIPGVSEYVTTVEDVFTLRTFNLTGFTFFNNSSTFEFRIRTKFFESTTTYAPTNNTSTYGTSGTIRYDLINIKGTAIGCVGGATQQANNFSIYRSFPTASYYRVNRGNGAGVLVVARAGGAVNTNPADGTNYTASSVFGAGSQIGAGNFVIGKSTVSGPGIYQNFASGLTPGTTYHYAIYEISSSGNCYLLPALRDSFVAGANILYPGNINFIGWDANVSAGGVDRFYLLANTDLAIGTQFGIMNACFETGAAANVRSNQWYGGNGTTSSDPILFTLRINSAIARGSVIAFDYDNNALSNLRINNATSTAMQLVAGTGQAGNVLSTTDAENIFLVQGKLQAFGTAGTAGRYSTLQGNVLAGFNKGNDWVNFSATPATNTRTSRVPPDIECTKLNFGTSLTTGFASYLSTAPTSGNSRQIIAAINNVAGNWQAGNGTAADNVLLTNANINNAFNIAAPVYGAYEWVGGGTPPNDWFDCANWYNYAVPDELAYVELVLPASGICAINSATSANAAKYQNRAQAAALNSQFIELRIAQNDSLEVFDFLDLASSNASLNMSGGNNKIKFTNARYLNGQCNAFATTTMGGNSQWNFSGTVPQFTDYCNVPVLTINNSEGLEIRSRFKVSEQLNLTKGLIKPWETPCTNGSLNRFIITSNTTIASPVTNNYGNNQGYAQSFINLPVVLEANSTTDKFIPVGANGIFAPVQFRKLNTNPCNYEIEYQPVTPPDIFNITPNLDHVSQVEYWDIKASGFTLPGDAFTQVGLSWRPTSFVNALPSGNWQDSICVAHYYNPGIGNSWLVERDLPLVQPFNQVSGNLNYGMVQSNRYVGNFSPFTLGSLSRFLALPVKLLSFDPRKNNNGLVDATWTVAEETRMQTYVVEHSTDGNNFSTVFSIPANNNAGIHRYAANDLPLLNGKNFYRLKMIDQQQAIRYSDLRQLNNGAKNIITLYPNPAKEKIFIQSTSAGGHYRIVDPLGRTILQGTINATNNGIDIRALAAGSYWLIFDTKSTRVAHMFIKA
jgi:hypothetical protein